jgi:hypothetical protein
MLDNSFYMIQKVIEKYNLLLIKMSLRTTPIKIPGQTPISNYIISSSSPSDKLSMMMKIMELRDAPYQGDHEEKLVCKSAPACILTEYMSAYMSESDDDLIYSIDSSEIDSELGEKDNNDMQELEPEIFEGDFTKDNPIIRKIFEDVTRCLLDQEEDIDLEIDHNDTPII